MKNQTITTTPVVMHFAEVVVLCLLCSVHAADSKPNGTDNGESSIQRYESVAKKLKSISTLPSNPTAAKQTIQSLSALSRSAPPKLGGIVLEAVCAGFIAIGDNASYINARDRLGNTKEFEAKMLETCPTCKGTRRSSTKCLVCNGKGRCSNCNGRRKVPVQCPKCSGTGKTISLERAKHLYQQRIADAIVECNNHLPESKRAPVPKTMSQPKPSSSSPAQGKADMSELRKSLGKLSRGPFLVEDIIHACDLLLVVQPNDEIRQLLGKCDYDLKPLRKAKDTKNNGDWLREIETLRKTALHIRQARQDAEPDNKRILFDYHKYVQEFCDRNSTALKRTNLLESFWDSSFPSKAFKEWVQVSFVPIPKGMQFVVTDVSTAKNEHGTIYDVQLRPLVYGKHDQTLGKEWRGDPNQTELYVALAKETGGIGSHLAISVERTDEPENWSKGTILKSEKWLATWGVEMSVSVFKDGHKEENRRIHDPSHTGLMFRSADEMKDFE